MATEPHGQQRLVLLLAEGMGVGRFPAAPGTVGSLAGLLWLAVLMSAPHPALFGIGVVAGLSLSVGICGRAELILERRDPGSVVLDEIAALPVCYAGWLIVVGVRTGAWPDRGALFSGAGWAILFFGWLLFRIFDIWKPWPIRASQNLVGGWGVTVDDFLAALYVNAILVPVGISLGAGRDGMFMGWIKPS